MFVTCCFNAAQLESDERELLAAQLTRLAQSEPFRFKLVPISNVIVVEPHLAFVDFTTSKRASIACRFERAAVRLAREFDERLDFEVEIDARDFND